MKKGPDLIIMKQQTPTLRPHRRAKPRETVMTGAYTVAGIGGLMFGGVVWAMVLCGAVRMWYLWE